MIGLGRRKAEGGRGRYRVALGSAAHLHRLPPSAFPRHRQALTLVELMVAIAIMGILASLLLGAAAVASEVARNARSKSLIARLHTLLVERYDGYRNQRVELKPFAQSDSADLRTLLTTRYGFNMPADLRPLPGGDQRVVAMARLAGLREIMRLELPDRWSDVVGWNDGGVTGLTASAPPPSDTDVLPAVTAVDLQNRLWLVQNVPLLTTVYARRYATMQQAGVNGEKARENESAECLYLIIMNATGDGEARGMFKPNDIGDTDEDGAPEFIDGWGKPISFLRWAPGFNSDAQLSMASLQRQQAKTNGDALVAQAILDDHDPFDLFRLDNPTAATLRGWRLVPLIVSGGGDEEIGLRFNGTRLTTLNPYLDIGSGNYLGEATDDQTNLAKNFDAELAGDNITNHNVGELSRK
jgi:prepilin-type N-terminal cleavage/methylation domain-containing protein